jgi:NAD-dependent deacetylase
MIEPAIELCAQADIFIIIGTSLNVYPAAGLLNYVPQGIPVYLIDPKEVTASRDGIHFIRRGASQGVGELVQQLKKTYL